jgi:hypothetical protein
MNTLIKLLMCDSDFYIVNSKFNTVHVFSLFFFFYNWIDFSSHFSLFPQPGPSPPKPLHSKADQWWKVREWDYVRIAKFHSQKPIQSETMALQWMNAGAELRVVGVHDAPKVSGILRFSPKMFRAQLGFLRAHKNGNSNSTIPWAISKTWSLLSLHS